MRVRYVARDDDGSSRLGNVGFRLLHRVCGRIVLYVDVCYYKRSYAPRVCERRAKVLFVDDSSALYPMP